MIKLINDDCLKILPTLESNSIDLILTDPPYGMNYQSNRRKDVYSQIANDNNLDWIEPLFKEYDRILKNNSSLLIFCNEYSIANLILEGNKHFKCKKPLIWVKNNHTSGDLTGDFANRTEFILHFQKGRNLIRGKRTDNVLQFKKTLNKLHPTEKPIDLLEHLITKLTDINALVLDSFAGSFSTGVACQNLYRNFIGIELDKDYFEIAKRRMNIEC